MFSIGLDTDADIKKMKDLLTHGSANLPSMAYSYVDGQFTFKSKDDYESAHAAFYELDEASELATALAGDLAPTTGGSATAKPRVPQAVSRYSKPTTTTPTNAPATQNRNPTPADRDKEEIATNLDKAMQRDPTLKRNLEKVAQKGGLTFEDAMTRTIVGDYLREYKNVAQAGAASALILGRLVETALDNISSQMVEYFVVLKSKRVKSISLSRLADLIKQSEIDIDPYQDMQFFIDLISSLPVVKDVQVDSNRVYLETPPQPGDEPEEEEELKDTKPKTDPMKDAAADKALDNLDDKVDQKELSLFKESSGNMEVVAFELAETLSDRLSSEGWAGEDDHVLEIGVQSIVDEYPGINADLVKHATIDMYQQFHSIK